MKKYIATALLLMIALTTYSQSAKEFLKKGGQEYKAKDYESALKTYKEGLKIYPDDAKLNLQTGLTYLSMPNKKESLTYLQTAFTLDPSVDEDIYYYLGLSYQSNHQFKSAEEFFTEYKRRNKKGAAIADAKIRQSQFADSLTRISSDVVVENIGKVINSSFHEYSPLVSTDGNTIIFTSNRPADGSSRGIRSRRGSPSASIRQYFHPVSTICGGAPCIVLVLRSWSISVTRYVRASASERSAMHCAGPSKLYLWCRYC